MNKRFYVTLFVLAVVALFAIAFSWWGSDDSSLKVHCLLQDITYKNISECKIHLADESCALPKTIECDLEAEGIADLIVRAVMFSG